MRFFSGKGEQRASEELAALPSLLLHILRERQKITTGCFHEPSISQHGYLSALKYEINSSTSALSQINPANFKHSAFPYPSVQEDPPKRSRKTSSNATSVTKSFFLGVLEPHTAENTMHEAGLCSVYGAQLKRSLQDRACNCFTRVRQNWRFLSGYWQHMKDVARKPFC